jgi:hypothetical protein
MFFDTRPANPPVVLITSHEMAEQITKITKQQPYSTTKYVTYLYELYLRHVLTLYVHLKISYS